MGVVKPMGFTGGETLKYWVDYIAASFFLAYFVGITAQLIGASPVWSFAIGAFAGVCALTYVVIVRPRSGRSPQP